MNTQTIEGDDIRELLHKLGELLEVDVLAVIVSDVHDQPGILTTPGKRDVVMLMLALTNWKEALRAVESEGSDQ
ncbi:MAG: hypothetical protein JOZ87_06035 [Chloroflexi bacterium]|nr:hypothetical protein [Chloroflexota bacterium]